MWPNEIIPAANSKFPCLGASEVRPCVSIKARLLLFCISARFKMHCQTATSQRLRKQYICHKLFLKASQIHKFPLCLCSRRDSFPSDFSPLRIYSTLKGLFHFPGAVRPRGSRLMNVKQETGKDHSSGGAEESATQGHRTTFLNSLC